MTASVFSLNATLFVDLAVFLLVLAIVSRYVIKPLQAAMSDRQARIEQAMAQARQAEELLAEAEAHYEEEMRRARLEARQLIEVGRDVGDDLRRRRSRSADDGRPGRSPQSCDTAPAAPAVADAAAVATSVG